MCFGVGFVAGTGSRELAVEVLGGSTGLVEAARGVRAAWFVIESAAIRSRADAPVPDITALS